MSLCGGLTKPGDRVDDRVLDLLLESLRQLLGSGGGWSHQANWEKEFRAKVSKNGKKFKIDHLAQKHSDLFFDLILVIGLTDQERAYGSL